MALSVAPLAGYPAKNSALTGIGGTPTDAATYTFTNSVYTQSGTQYVAGIIDKSGSQPARLFEADNNTGTGTQGTKLLPTLVSVTVVSSFGSSIQELPSTTGQVTGALGYSGFIVLLNTVAASGDDGVYPLGYVGPVGWTAQGGAYTNASPTVGYPQPQMRFFVSLNAMLILSSTSTG